MAERRLSSVLWRRSAAVTPRPFSMLKYAGRVWGAAIIVAIEQDE